MAPICRSRLHIRGETHAVEALVASVAGTINGVGVPFSLSRIAIVEAPDKPQGWAAAAEQTWGCPSEVYPPHAEPSRYVVNQGTIEFVFRINTPEWPPTRAIATLAATHPELEYDLSYVLPGRVGAGQARWTDGVLSSDILSNVYTSSR